MPKSKEDYLWLKSVASKIMDMVNASGYEDGGPTENPEMDEEPTAGSDNNADYNEGATNPEPSDEDKREKMKRTIIMGMKKKKQAMSSEY